MLTGKVSYRRADKTYLLEPGDALFFDCQAPHGPAELIETPMTYGEVERPKDADPPGTAAVDAVVTIAAIKGALGDRVSDVRASNRLVDSAACLVAGGQGPDRELERLLSRQKRGVGSKPVLEINTSHPLVKGISDARLSGSDDLAELCQLLFEQALILDGDVPDDPAGFARRMNRFVVRGLSSSMAKAPNAANS
jgi:molecular chaperone HtpG